MKDDEIKSYVKEILEGANLEEITMKTVCKQVYAHYPDFDLSHKKDFIKSTVKSVSIVVVFSFFYKNRVIFFFAADFDVNWLSIEYSIGCKRALF